MHLQYKKVIVMYPLLYILEIGLTLNRKFKMWNGTGKKG